MSEIELLEKIFGDGPTFQGLPIRWCDQCDTYIVGCPDPKCHGSSCNCGGCEKCLPIHEAFNTLKPWPTAYMLEHERSVIEKYMRIKRLLKECLAVGLPFDIQWLNEHGKLSENDLEIFNFKP